MDNNNLDNNEQDKQNKNNNDKNNKKKPSATIIILILSVFLTLIFWQVYSKFKKAGQEKISYSEFITMLEDGKVSEVKIYDSEITFKPVEQDPNAVYEVSYYVVRTDDYNIVDRLYQAGVEFEELEEGGTVLFETKQ